MLSFIAPVAELMTWLDDYYLYYSPGNVIRHSERIANAERIRLYFESRHPEYYRESFYRACASIMVEQPRLALYLPFKELHDAPIVFREKYMEAWHGCRSDLDVRECFNLGDICEPGANKGRPELVKKAYHLLPWLVRYGYISGTRLMVEIEEAKESGDVYTLNAIADALPYFRKYVSAAVAIRIERMLLDIPKVPVSTLSRTTPKRQRWPQAREGEKAIELSCPTGPFSNNINLIAHAIMNEPDKGEAFLIGGPMLKGYGRNNADINIYRINLENGCIKDAGIGERNALPGEPDLAHIYMNTVWCANCRTKELQQLRAKIIEPYFEKRADDIKKRIELRLEQDLLQFDLMHRGMKMAYPQDISLETRHYKTINGASAFYDERYRRIATSLFASYVWLPPQK